MRACVRACVCVGGGGLFGSICRLSLLPPMFCHHSNHSLAYPDPLHESSKLQKSRGFHEVPKFPHVYDSKTENNQTFAAQISGLKVSAHVYACVCVR